MGLWPSGAALRVMVGSAGLWDSLAGDRAQEVVRAYLDELEPAIENLGDQPAKLEAVLKDLRSRIRKDLLMGNLTERHYRNLEEQVAMALTDVRHAAFRNQFEGLPHGLVVRLETLLEDGVLEESEYDLFRTMIEAAGVPQQQKDILLDRLRDWVREDAGRVR